MTPGLLLTIVWQDEDLHEVAAEASNNVFAGKAQFYVERGGLGAAAERLKGFPSRVGESVQIKFEETGGGGLLLDCRASHGPVHVRIELRSGLSEPPGHCEVEMLADPSAIDTFVAELAALETDSKRKATLAANPQC